MRIYYYTRTNRSENIAKALSKQYNLQVHKIQDYEKWGGALNYVKAGAMASSKKTVDITYEPIQEDETIILVFPIWAGTFPPAVRAFLQDKNKGNIIAIPTSLASKLKERNEFKAVFDLVGKEISPPNLGKFIEKNT